MRTFLNCAAFLVLAIAWNASAMTYEKKEGANNPSVDAGDKYRFACAAKDKVVVDERGQVFSTAGKLTKLRTLPTNGGFFIRYLECMVRNGELFYVYEEANASDAGVVVGRCPLRGGACTWRVSVGVPNVGIPVFGDATISLSLGILDVDLNVATGRMAKWKGTGCLVLSRTDEQGGRGLESVGPSCK